MDKDYYGTPLFIISTLGDYDSKWIDDKENWEKFSLLM